MPEIDDECRSEFRANITKLAQQIPDQLSDDDKLELTQSVLREFENYCIATEMELIEQRAHWRTLASTLARALMEKSGIDHTEGPAAPLLQRIGSLTTFSDIQAHRILLVDFLRLGGNRPSRTSSEETTDCSGANNNAVGLRDGGAAVEHVRKIMSRGGNCFLVLFHTPSLERISRRYGCEAVQDSQMAISAYLISSLRSDDTIYYWSDCSLLAVLVSPATEEAITAAMQRIVSNIRDITIQIEGRSVMLRVTLNFDLIPISRLKTADDLYKHLPEQATPK